MKLGSLFSGGKDSTFAISLVQKQGHDVLCLLSVFPKSDQSHLLHHPNIKWTKLQSESMNIPQLITFTDSDDIKTELSSLESLLLKAKNDFGIEGLVHGGIKSNFQKNNFESVCLKLGLKVFSPLWDLSAEQYMRDLLNSDFVFMMISVSSDGLDDSWLGKIILQSDLPILSQLANKFGFNLNFEGGEAETFVINCPLFSNSIDIIDSKKIWDGYRGRFEIVDAGLNYHA